MELNPYDPPETIAVQPRELQKVTHGTWLLSFEWTAVYLLNLVIPSFLAWTMTTAPARIGALGAIVILLAVGYCLCQVRPLWMLVTIRGSFLVAISQIFPILQIMCGALAIRSLIFIGWIEEANFREMLGTTASGFIVTMLTGGSLLLISAVLGLILMAISPRRWWTIPSPNSQTQK